MGKERPIIFTTESVKAILEGRKTQTRRVVTPYTSEVGEGRVDWGKFCWDGSQIYQDTCTHGHTEEHKAPLPFVDGKASEQFPYDHQYLHIPWNWEEDMTIFRIYPRWDVGDRLWVREALRGDGQPHNRRVGIMRYASDGEMVIAKHDMGGWFAGSDVLWNYKNPVLPAIFMPRWASRLTLEITEVRVERLQEISWDDTHKEGILRYDREHPDPSNGGMGYNRGAEGLPERYESIAAFMDLWDSLNAKRGYGWDKNPWVWVIKFDNIGVRVK